MTGELPGALYLERPSFWTEPGDPEVWFRALDTIAAATTSEAQTGTPRTVAERCLDNVVAWRGAIGLFGVWPRGGRTLLPGVGLVARDAADRWTVTDEALALVRSWRENPARGLEVLAGQVVREGPWLRLLLLRIRQGDWEIVNWPVARSSRAGLKAGISLRLCRHAEPAEWFAGLEQTAAGRWLARSDCQSLAYAPDLFARAKGKDDLSLSPLTAPLHLLELVGWLTPLGRLSLPADVLADLVGEARPAQVLAAITARRADVRGCVPVEPVLRELLATFGKTWPDESFARWMDRLVDDATAGGGLEILAAEPGQARHGRGLGGDPARKLVRWVVHDPFDDVFREASAAMDAGGPNPRAGRVEVIR